MKKPRLYYTGGNETCLACRHGWPPFLSSTFLCDKHDRDIRNPDCHRCRDWEPKNGSQLTVDVPPSS